MVDGFGENPYGVEGEMTDGIETCTEFEFCMLNPPLSSLHNLGYRIYPGLLYNPSRARRHALTSH